MYNINDTKKSVYTSKKIDVEHSIEPEFYSIDTFPAVRTLSANWMTIYKECQSLLNSEYYPWPEKNIYNHNWSVYGLYFQEKQLIENCLFCPETTILVEKVPGMVSAGYSRMGAGCHIRPHTGYTRDVLRLHLGLHVPHNCGLRVGSETRHWKEGHCLVFDDTLEHEAWNHSDVDRIVLLIDIKRDIYLGSIEADAAE